MGWEEERATEPMPWETEGDLPWISATPWCPAELDEPWLTAEADGWPEDLAGPEYWLFRHEDDPEG